MSVTKPILISGSGLASLLLAQSLRLSKIPFRIFERDESFIFRAQGYRLRLSTEGLDAIESVLDAKTWEHFWDKCGKTGGSGFSAFDAVTGEQTEHVVPEKLVSRGGKVVGIARGDMRRIFAEGCEDHIEWSRNVTGYELTDDGVRAIFSDGTKSIEGSMLVGGEGIYSKVAKQVSGGKLKVYDTGARGIHGQAPTTAFKGLGEGVFRLRDATRSDGAVFIITNVRPGELDDPNVEFGWTMGGEPGVIRAPNDDYTIVGKQAADIAKSISKDWHPRFKPLFDEMNESEAAFWKITCSTPSGVPEWPNEPRVTVIGDAVHSMTPAGGIGANTAVRDSALLGRLLREAGGYKPGVTAAYEKEMRVYASEAVNESYTGASGAFGIKIDEETSPVV
ncbi:FAD-binding-3 domain-containing protein [Fusarium keratoplasticum]|uniref:FAD-binding-3 domain-containing protein n=1 Tax=Fusarium keratoplasticum TaxID=1328300 RepID=A0ACC0QT32_9HYPO|nr:FAD-binding-3 domain-containing protein [Fusarium keratoplasticum]KAI8663677.1 FAD-binding-3 domain-containing protein [Fusarium keratoplasticum]KAI8664322.1 FAD-binding-3 domain-containing protein [Fusarium keratoplasticum]